MARRSKSSGRWLQEHFSDPFVQRAKSEGWRSRAVYKLEEIDRKEKLLKPGAFCLDLGAAPGAWSQYAARRVGEKGRVIATDILPMDGLTGVEFVQGDFREEPVIAQIVALVAGGQVDVVLSDMAPNLSGVDAIDQPRSMYLAELAFDLAERVLKRDGSALIKVFQGAGFQEFVAASRRRFARVKLWKPEASRSRSPELYLLAKGFGLV
jgi:23S rRNA (uridine2552-2'-O)-methyltransferase